MSMKFIGFLKKQMAHIAFYVCVLLVFAQISAVFAYQNDGNGNATVTVEENKNAEALADLQNALNDNTIHCYPIAEMV